MCVYGDGYPLSVATVRRGLWAGAPQVATMRTATDDEALHEMREGSQCRFAVFRPAVPSTAQHAATLSTRFIIMESYPRPPVVVPSAVKFSEKVTRAEHAESFKYQKVEVIVVRTVDRGSYVKPYLHSHVYTYT